MAKSARAAGTQWAGLNKRVDPVDLGPEQSPDCANVFFYDQTIGLLGPRLGKTYAGASAHTIWGVLPYNIAGQIGALVAYGDDTSTEIDLLNLYSVTYPHWGWGDAARSGPAPGAVVAITRNLGFTYEWDGPSGAAPAPHECDVALNGATRVTATCPSIEWETVGTLWVELQFDGGGWHEANELYAEATSGCCGTTLDVDVTPTLVDCSAFTALTGIRVTSDGDGSEEFSGTVRVTGCCV